MIELEFFRTQHRHCEVDKKSKGDESGEEGFHGGGWLEGFAALGVNAADDEEGNEDEEVDEVDHEFIPIVAPIRQTESQRTGPGR